MQTGTSVQGVSREKPRAATADRERVPTYFHTECSVCGRPLRVLVEHLGQRVACPRRSK